MTLWQSSSKPSCTPSSGCSASSPGQFADVRRVGREMLPTTVASLLIHIAEHTQRHVGQAITTAKVVAALRESQVS